MLGLQQLVNRIRWVPVNTRLLHAFSHLTFRLFLESQPFSRVTCDTQVERYLKVATHNIKLDQGRFFASVYVKYISLRVFFFFIKNYFNLSLWHTKWYNCKKNDNGTIPLMNYCILFNVIFIMFWTIILVIWTKAYVLNTNFQEKQIKLKFKKHLGTI